MKDVPGSLLYLGQSNFFPIVAFFQYSSLLGYFRKSHQWSPTWNSENLPVKSLITNRITYPSDWNLKMVKQAVAWRGTHLQKCQLLYLNKWSSEFTEAATALNRSTLLLSVRLFWIVRVQDTAGICSQILSTTCVSDLQRLQRVEKNYLRMQV